MSVILRLYKFKINVYVVLSVLIILLIYLLARKIFYTDKKRDLIAVLSSVLIGISPGHIYLSQRRVDAIVLEFLIVVGIFLLFKAMKQKVYLVLSLIFFILSIYLNYFTALFILALLLGYGYLNVEKTESSNKKLYLSLIGGLIISTLIILASGFTVKTDTTNLIFNDDNVLYDYKIERLQGSEDSLVSAIFHNKILFYGRTIINNYFYYFTPEFLFIDAGLRPAGSYPKFGLMYIWQSIFLVFGLYFIFRNKIKYKLLLWWLFLAPTIGVCFVNAPSINQSALMILPMHMVIAYGAVEFFKTKNKKSQIFILPLLFFAVILDLLKFINGYYFSL
jgi:hypothetical protein